VSPMMCMVPDNVCGAESLSLELVGGRWKVETSEEFDLGKSMSYIIFNMYNDALCMKFHTGIWPHHSKNQNDNKNYTRDYQAWRWHETYCNHCRDACSYQ